MNNIRFAMSTSFDVAMISLWEMYVAVSTRLYILCRASTGGSRTEKRGSRPWRAVTLRVVGTEPAVGRRVARVGVARGRHGARVGRRARPGARRARRPRALRLPRTYTCPASHCCS